MGFAIFFFYSDYIFMQLISKRSLRLSTGVVGAIDGPVFF